MLYLFDRLEDRTEVTCSEQIRTGDVVRVQVHFERPVCGGFDSARYLLPDHRWLFTEGYTAEELRCFDKYIKQNEGVFWHRGCSTSIRRIQNDLCTNDERCDESLLTKTRSTYE